MSTETKEAAQPEILLYAKGLRWAAENMPLKADWPVFLANATPNNRAVCLLYGMAIPQAQDVALAMFRENSKKSPASLNNLGVCALYGLGGAKPDHTFAFQCFQEAAAAGLPMALVNQGRCYEWGNAYDKDAEMAEDLYRHANNLGSLTGSYCLAILYLQRGNVEYGIAKMLEAGRKGYLPAIMSCLQHFWQEKSKFKDNGSEMLQWVAKYGQESPMLKFLTGKIYEIGYEPEFPRNRAKAIAYYEEALTEDPTLAYPRSALVDLLPEKMQPEALFLAPGQTRYQQVIIRELLPAMPDVLVDLIVDYNVFTLHVGDRIDVLDTINHWMTGRVVEARQETACYKISYDGWSYRWDEWISLYSDRLAPLGTHEYWLKNPETHPKLEYYVQEVQKAGFSEIVARFGCIYVQDCQRALTVQEVLESLSFFQNRQLFLALVQEGIERSQILIIEQLVAQGNIDRVRDYLSEEQIQRLKLVPILEISNL